MNRKLFWKVAVAGLLIAIIMAHSIWTLVEGKSMRRRVAALQAAKEPILPGDFNVTDGADNSSTDILAAAGKVDFRSENWKAVDKLNLHLPLRDDERKAIEAIVAETKPALELLEQARKKPRNEWPVQLQSPVLNSMLSDDFSKVRSLCSMLRTLALYEHDRGNDAAALRHLETSIFLGEYVDTFPSIVAHLVSIGARAVAANYAAEIAPDLRVGTAPGNAAPQDVRRLIDALLDERGLTAGVQRALRGERMMQLDTMESMIGGNPPAPPTGVVPPAKQGGVSRYVMRPIFYRNARIMLDHMTQIIPAGASADFPAATTTQKASAAAAQSSALNPYVRILLPGMERFLQTPSAGSRIAASPRRHWRFGGTRLSTMGSCRNRSISSCRNTSRRFLPIRFRRAARNSSTSVKARSPLCTASATTARTTAGWGRRPT